MDPSSGKEVEVEFPPFFTLYKDGSVRRSDPTPHVPPSPELHDGVASKDVHLNPELGLWARIFLPASHPPSHKLPIVLYFHGGAFLFGSPACSNFHDFCTDMALRSSAICVSASYRLAPEHRLPAAIDDGFAALQWLRSQSLLLQQTEGEGGKEQLDDWLAMADFSNCFIAGESAGGTIAHHVVMRACTDSTWQSRVLCIKGLILIHPAFLRATRTQEELDCYQDGLSNWDVADVATSLALPLGAGSIRDDNYPLYFNPFPGIKSLSSLSLPSTLVALAEKDVLHFTGLKYVQALKEAGCCKKVDLLLSHGVGHVFFVAEPQSEQALQLMERIAAFIREEAAS